MPADDPAPIRLNVVAGGLGEWYEKRERQHEATPYVFVDVEAHPELLELPDRARQPEWRASAEWAPGGTGIAVQIEAPERLNLAIGLENPQLRALVALIERDHAVAICPTTPQLGLNARLARDRSLFFTLPPRADA
jgi:hypothetical protein